LAALNECIAEMNAMTALSPLDWGEGLYKAADEWARTQGPTGQTGHASNTWDRVKKYCSYSTSGENISYGPNTGKEIVIQLLVDYGVADRGHRKNILSSKFTHAGAAIETHSYYRYECVIDYAGGYREK
ncbi:MAG: CAP domain-containing protein, partial [Treponema sp.]|nr:CAP domain-containing protein [Treponema sp.]